MANTRLRMPEAEVIVDDKGGIIGFSSQGKDVFFPRILAQSSLPVNLTGSTSEVELARIVIPGGILGAHGSLRVSTMWTATGAGGTRTTRIKIDTQTVGTTSMAAANLGMMSQLMVRNRGNQALQSSNPSMGTSFGVSNSGPIQTGRDLSLDQVLTITGQLASAADSMQLDGYIVEVLPWN